jgi:hypothetical protein
MPMGPVYDRMIDSPIADMKNIGGKFGGSITAAQFLLRYIEKGTLGASRHRGHGLGRQGGPHLGQGRDRLWRAPARPFRARHRRRVMPLRVDFYLVGQGDALVALPPLAAAAMKAGQRMLVVAGMAGSASAFPRRCGLAPDQLPRPWRGGRRA